MVQQSINPEGNILSGIKEGMNVYDSENQKLGTVVKLHFGSSTQTANEDGKGAASAVDPDMREESLIDSFMKTIFGDSSLPEVIRSRLILNGFIKIDSNGLFTEDLYAMPEQIANAAGQDVHLTVTGDSLIKG